MPAAHWETDIISFLRSKNIMRPKTYITSRKRYIIPFVGGVSMPENPLVELSFEFALTIIKLSDTVTMPKSSYMLDQLARAGTSIGANIHEAQYAQSKRDFISKLEIALKESNETSYWLRLLFNSDRIDLETYRKAEAQCGKIRRLLIASCKTAKSGNSQISQSNG